jgi:hypothetical protein
MVAFGSWNVVNWFVFFVVGVAAGSVIGGPKKGESSGVFQFFASLSKKRNYGHA